MYLKLDFMEESAIFFISTDYLSHRSGFQNMGGGQGLLALPEEYYFFAKFTPRFPGCGTLPWGLEARQGTLHTKGKTNKTKQYFVQGYNITKTEKLSECK